MKRVFTSTCQIARPIAEVFDLLCRPELFPFYLPAIKEAHWEDDSPVAIGKAYLETREALGSKATARVYISQLLQPELIAYKSTAAGITGEYIYNLQALNDTTVVSLEAFVKSSGIASLILPVFVYAMKKDDSKQLASLKEYLERPTLD